MSQDNEQVPMKKAGSFFSKTKAVVMRFILVLSLLLFSLPIAVYLLVQVPQVQQWGIQKMEDFMFKEYGAVLRIKSFSMSFSDILSLEEAEFYSPEGDTILMAGELKVSLGANIFNIFRGRLSINSVSLKDIYFHYREYLDGTNNLKFLESKRKANREGTKSNFQIELRQVLLSNVRAKILLDSKAKMIVAALALAELDISESDFFNNSFTANRVSLLKPEFQWVDSKVQFDLPVDKKTAISDGESPSKNLGISLKIKKLAFKDGRFVYDNQKKEDKRVNDPKAFDYNHLDVHSIAVDIEHLELNGSEASAAICHMSLQADNGFKINRLQSDEFTLRENEAVFRQMILETPGSTFSDYLAFYFSNMSDFENFEDAVFMDARVKTGSLLVNELFYFAPTLKNNRFFKKYADQKIEFTGNINGRVNNLRGANLEVNFANQVRYFGDFSSRDLTEPTRTLLNLDIKSLSTDISSLRQLIPGLELPVNFNKLGRIQYRGRFDGFYGDFVTFGKLNSELGLASLDLKLNTLEGMKKASYSGGLNLQNFNLSKWTDNPDFGKLTAQFKVSNGRGLTIESVRANLNASIQSLDFKNYEYKDISFIGVINKDLLDGQVLANDENMQLDFLGTIDFSGETPLFKFHSKIDLIDLGALKLIEHPFSLSGDLDIDANIKDLYNVDGIVTIRNLILAKSDLHFLHVGNIRLESRYLHKVTKSVSFNSDLFDLEVSGDLDYQHFWRDIVSAIASKNKNFSKSWKLEHLGNVRSENDFTFDVQIHNTKNLAEILSLPLDTVRNARFSGRFSNDLNGQFSYRIHRLIVPSLQYDKIFVKSLLLQAEGNDENSEIVFHVDSALVYGVDIITTDGIVNWKRDTIFFRLGMESILKTFGQMGIVGSYFLVEDRNHIQFNNLEFEALSRRWRIQRQNFIQVSDEFLYARNMLFSDGSAYVNFSTFDTLGLHCQANNVDLAIFDRFLEKEGIELAGKLRADLYVQNVWKMQQMYGNARLTDLIVKDIPVGDVRLLASHDDFNQPIILNLEVLDAQRRATGHGYFYPSKNNVPTGLHQYELNALFDQFSISVSDVFLKGIFSGTEGEVSGEVKIAGNDSLEELQGWLLLKNARTKVDYLGTRYRLDSAQVRLSPKDIDLGDIQLWDQAGNAANLRGGIKHHFFKDMELNLRITSPQFQALNLSKRDNELFYGRAFGKIDVRINGPFDRLDMLITAETAPNTVVSIPLSSAIDDKEQNFIVFVNGNDDLKDEAKNVSNVTGINLEMYLTITPVAELQLIFNERTGEIIRGRGNGNIRLVMPREGTFQMFGDFEIERGEYPFKAFVVLDKAFTIRRGGTISWYGDPLNASINLQAEYKGLRTSPYNFIYEFIRNDNNLLNEAKRPTDVDLILNLSGQLLQPAIQFDLAFPALQGELKNYTDNRLRTLAANPDELNMTAVSLLAFKGFLPQTTDLLSTAAISNTVSSTLTEWVTNQMRVFVNEYLIDTLGSGGLVSNLNLDFGIILNPAIEVDGQPSVAGLAQSQFYIRPQFQFLDDRVTLDMGVTTFGDVTAGGRVGSEFNVEYAFGQSRRLRARAYAQNQPLINDNRIVSGVGLTYRREYDSFYDIFRPKANRQRNNPEPNPPTYQSDPKIKEEESEEDIPSSNGELN